MNHRLLRPVVPLVTVLVLMMSAVAGVATSPQQTAQAAPGVIWSADLEDGSLRAWDRDGGGGAFNSGGGQTSASRDRARSGSYSAKLTINTNGSDVGARLHRWRELDQHNALYFSAWYYFPQRVTVHDGWWNIMQFKSRNSRNNDPWWILYVGNRSNGNNYIYLRDWINKRSYQQSVADLPVGRWVHIEAYLQQSGSNSGRLTVWQDGVQLFDMRNIRTKYGDGNQTWGITNYSSRLSPSPTTIYVDDAVISTQRVGSGGSPAPNPNPNPDPTPSPTPNPNPNPSPTPTPTPAPSGELRFQSPANGANVNGRVTFQLSAPNNTAGIWFWRDNWVWLGDDYNSGDGWSYTLDTSSLSPGQHTLIARAVDSSNRTLDEKTLTFNVTASGLSFQSPSNGSTVSGRVTFRLNAPSNTAGIWFWRDNWVWLGDDYNSGDGWSYTLDTRRIGNGQHTLIARAVDSRDRTLDEKTLTFNVRN